MNTPVELRAVRLRISKPSGRVFTITDLRMAFNIIHNLDQEAAPSTIKIYNLAAATAEELAQGDDVVMEAGYGDEIALIHRGDTRFVYHERLPTDRITTLDLGAAGESRLETFVSESGAPTYVDEVRSMSEKMGLGINEEELLDLVPGGRVIGGSLGFIGAPAAGLTQLLSGTDITWFEENGVLRFTNRQQANKFVKPIVISEATGMIASPSFIDDERAGVRVRVILTSQIELANQVTVESGVISGTFKVTRIAHQGDNWEGAWETEIEAKSEAD